MRFKLCAAALFLVSSASTASAQHGAGDDRVSLPEGPGSLEGIGDNAAISGNMGSMSYSVPIEVPAGFPAVTPNLALNYDSAGPAGVMGIGWDMPVPFVERMTNWRLPDYDLDDDFVAGGQLVHVGDGVYRNRFEKGFSRHTWHDRGDGTQGYWTTELPDGTVQYFGATPDGTLVDSARVAGRSGATFRYHLVAQVDTFGHRMDFSYRLYDGLPHLDRIEYIFTGSDGGPGASLSFEYEDRPDALSDARSGSNERRTQRLTHVNVFSKQVRIWRYSVHYEDEALSNGLSRVRRIDRVGLNETPHPVAFDFEYSKTLANDNCDADCDQPYLVDMGSIGVNLAAGDATLADMNGDGLPDIIDTSGEGAHRIFVNRFAARDQHVFDAPYDSAVGDRAGHQLSSPYVQTLDANGDGRVDLVNVRTGEVLYNLGGGDWAEASALDSTAALPDFGDDFGGGADEPTHVRFFDYDNDRRIDVLRSSLDQTQIYANQGEAGFAVVDGINAIGAGFDGGLDLADMNGDGLLDPVILRPGSLSYRLNLGFGRWSGWTDIENLPFNEAELDFVQLQDINGDSLDDLVVVIGDELRFALNRAGTHFDAEQTIDSVGGQALPIRVDGTTVLFADMNGSGSDDVVWITAQGDVTYLELFPIRPNLLTKLTNGLGLVTEVTYTTMAEELADTDEPWAFTLPFSMLVAKTIDTYDSYNAVHALETFTYRDAYYDTEEKTYRGFAEVSVETAGDETQDTGVRVEQYDVGAEDRYRNGLLLQSAQYGVIDDALVPLRMTRSEYADCPVSGVDGNLAYPVRSLCQTASEVVLQEGAPTSEWATTRSEYTYDGYGNRTLEAQLGVVSIGDAGCPAIDRPADAFGAPSGAACTGDEFYTAIEYVDPAQMDHWIINLESRRTVAATLDADAPLEFTYQYDGEAFEGLPVGQATLGQLIRTRQRVDDATWIDVSRVRYDAHGNVVESLNPRGFRTLVEYDDEHLLVTQNEEELQSPDGQTYRLRTQTEHDPIWGIPSRGTDVFVVIDDAAVTPVRWWRYVYDELSRPLQTFAPGDPDDRPRTQHIYETGAPVSRVVTEGRRVQGQADPDLYTVRCFDGFGRPVADYFKAGPDHFEASRWAAFNRAGSVVRDYRGHRMVDDRCALDAPDVEPTRVHYDALGRIDATTLADAGLHGTASRIEVVYGPLSITRADPRDTDADDPAFDTPRLQIRDGLERPVAIEYVLPDSTLRSAYTYDVRGNLQSVTDPSGFTRRMTWDRAGRLLTSTDADRGTRTYAYDAAGNVTEVVDDAGRVTRNIWDGRNRLISTWDGADEATRAEAFFDLPSLCPSGWCENTAGRQVGARFRLKNDDGWRWFTYDARGFQAGLRTVIDGVALDVLTSRDSFGQITALEMPDGGRVEYTRDGMQRVTRIDGIIDALTWQRGPLVDTMTLANGTRIAHAFDAMDRLRQKTVEGPGGQALLSLAFERDRMGFVTQVTENAPRANAPSALANYTLDALGRIETAVLDGGRPDFEETLTYTYDASQRMLSKTSSKGAASASHIGALSYPEGRFAAESTDRHSMDYDAAGMLIGKDAQTFEWDHLGRLTRVLRDGTETARMWNGLGDARVMTQEGARVRYSLTTNFEIEDGIAQTRVYLGELPVALRETDTIATAVLTDVAPQDAPDEQINAADAVMIEGGTATHERPLSTTRQILRASVRRALLQGEPRLTFLHTGESNHTLMTTNMAGAIEDQNRFDPQGIARDGALSGRAYSDKQVDDAGLVFFGARYYDPALGRWISPDPRFHTPDTASAIGQVFETSDPYLFNLNNPIAYTDPDGRTGEIQDQVNVVIAAIKAVQAGVDDLPDFGMAQMQVDRLQNSTEYTNAQTLLTTAITDLKAVKTQLESAAFQFTSAVGKLTGKDATATALQKADRLNQSLGLAPGKSIADGIRQANDLTAKLTNAMVNLQGAITARQNFANGGQGNLAWQQNHQTKLANQRAQRVAAQQRDQGKSSVGTQRPKSQTSTRRLSQSTGF
jgi:RHS repeat-associated protein